MLSIPIQHSNFSIDNFQFYDIIKTLEINMIKKLAEIKELKKQLNVIKQKYKNAKKLKNKVLTEETLTKVYCELVKFESENCKKEAYTKAINRAVFALYRKIDSYRLTYMEYHDEFYYQQHDVMV